VVDVIFFRFRFLHANHVRRVGLEPVDESLVHGGPDTIDIIADDSHEIKVIQSPRSRMTFPAYLRLQLMQDQMFIYNVSTQVAEDMQDEWLRWMKEEHIPEVLSTGHFTHHRIVRLREPQEPGSTTFAVQYFCNSLALYDHYVQAHAPALRQKTLEKWGDRIISFRTLMEVIN
jgi:hypothetical protein